MEMPNQSGKLMLSGLQPLFPLQVPQQGYQTAKQLLPLPVTVSGAAVPRGPTADAVPPGTDVTADGDHIGKQLVAVINLAVTPLVGKDAAPQLQLVAAIPVVDCNEPCPAQSEQRKEHTAKTVIIQLPVLHLVLHQRADLLVQHPVRLCDEDHIEAQLPVLGEERHPGVAILPPEIPAIEDDLTLVNDNQRLPLPADPVPLQSVCYQPLRCQLRIVPILHVGLWPLHEVLIDREITDQAASPFQTSNNILCRMEALAAARRPGIQCNAHSITFTQRRAIW